MAINKRVAAAMKKVAKPKRKKTWADSQSAPQSKVYKPANDKAVLAKPVGFRWTDLGAARLGKNASIKPSAADIEKYKGKTFSKAGSQHSYLYSEKRADKTDVKKSEKFKSGGRPKKTWADSQNPPQSTVYKAVNDKEVVAKPVGFRWTGYGAAKLGVNVMSKPSAADIEQYKNKTFKLRGESVRYLYSEKRADKSDVKRKDKFEDGGMYGDGGELSHKYYITYVSTNYDGKTYKEGFDLYSTNGDSEEEQYIDWFPTLKEAKEEAEEQGLEILPMHMRMADGGMMAKGGTFGGRQYDPYNEPADKARHAKPIGWRFTDAKAKRLKESPYEKPTAEQIEKYRGKGVYFENRQDKSDRTYSRKLADGGLADNEGLRVSYVFVDVYEDSYERGEGRHVTGYSMPEFKRKLIQKDKVLDFLSLNLYLSENASDYVIIDDCIHYDQLQDEDGSEASEYDKEQWREGKKVLYNAHYTICFDVYVREYERKLTDGELSAMTGIGVYRSGGAVQSGVQSENYSEDRDKLVVAKPVGWRFTNKFAKRKGFDAYRKPTAEEIEKYKGSGKIYYEVRFDKSDKNVRRRFEDGGMMADGGMMDDSYARGGAPKISNGESSSYTENMLPFKANNLEGKTLDNGDYVVLSYGYYPIWFYSAATHKWYGNKDKYSQSTAKQISQSRPTYDATILPKRELDEVMFSSSLGKLHDEERIVEANV